MLTPEQINEIRTKSGLKPIQASSPNQSSQPKQAVGRFDYLLKKEQSVGEKLLTGAKKVIQNTKDNFNKVGETYDKNKNLPATFLSATALAPKAVGDAIFEGIKAFIPDETKENIKAQLSSILSNPELQEKIKAVSEPIQRFSEKNPQTAQAISDVAEIGSSLIGVKGAQVGGKTLVKAGQATGKAVGEAGQATGRVLVKAGDKLSTPMKAIGQTGSELAERVPRAIGRLKESADDAVIRSARIREAAPEVANAIKSKLDDKFINTIAEVDEPTRKAFKQVVDIAEETPKSIGLKKQPSIVSGELASKQFDIINKQKQSIGKQLGDKVRELSKTEKIDMSNGFIELDDTLASQGIYIKYTKKGPKLDFSGTKYTPAERTKIQELYTLASEGGESLSPSSIHGKDQLFSKLQREAAMEGVGKIMVETPEGNKSLFSVFRDVFSKNLEDVSPEIRDLNQKYRNFSLITEDIEDSILRTPNFNITKPADPAEFAKVNLRRIFGEAQSSPVFEAIADQMDDLARQLGYADASPKQVAEFAQELRKLYPESIPKAGFSGGISSSVSGALGNALEATLKAGAPNLKDQRKALRELLESYFKKPISTDVKGKVLKKTSK